MNNLYKICGPAAGSATKANSNSLQEKILVVISSDDENISYDYRKENLDKLNLKNSDHIAQAGFTVSSENLLECKFCERTVNVTCTVRDFNEKHRPNCSYKQLFTAKSDSTNKSDLKQLIEVTSSTNAVYSLLIRLGHPEDLVFIVISTKFFTNSSEKFYRTSEELARMVLMVDLLRLNCYSSPCPDKTAVTLAKNWNRGLFTDSRKLLPQPVESIPPQVTSTNTISFDGTRSLGYESLQQSESSTLPQTSNLENTSEYASGTDDIEEESYRLLSVEFCHKCYVVKANTLLLPCSHLVICQNCYQSLKRESHTVRCPLCNTPSQSSMLVYHS